MPIPRAEKAAYNEYIKEYKVEIEEKYKSIKGIETKKKKVKNISLYYNFEIIREYLSIITIYIDMSDASLELLNIKNELFLNNSRKEIYKVFHLMEEIVSNHIDRSLKENSEYLKKIDRINPDQILNYIKNIIDIRKKMVEKFGDGSKWKWSFVELQGRLAVIIKNFINFSDLQKYRDPRTEFYHSRQQLLKLCKQHINEAAKQYRNKYEVSGKVPGDMLKAIDLLSSLRRISVLMREPEEAEKLKNTIEALRVRMESDEKKNDDEKKKINKI